MIYILQGWEGGQRDSVWKERKRDRENCDIFKKRDEIQLNNFARSTEKKEKNICGEKYKIKR